MIVVSFLRHKGTCGSYSWGTKIILDHRYIKKENESV